ncbi:unnamed protein product [Oppiella nova]|uniref:Uncharacterized protein n=1 Tax=Oppiella nova TaxID=334625 RepID=A0A7R9MET1_9ACAR|nr:unnamed protein product [Oppiella nova]CAG2176062.1 unnamed protein product [Oppiella nova]
MVEEEDNECQELCQKWQRLVLKPQVCLNMDEVVRKLIIRIDIKSRSQWFAKINWEALESMGKKLPNITSIDINISSEKTRKVFKRLMNSYKHSMIAINVQIMPTIVWIHGFHQNKSVVIDCHRKQ